MISFMLDTCTCIYVIRKRPLEVREQFRRNQSRLCISAVTFMELIKGVEKSADPEGNLKVAEGFTARLEVLDFDVNAAFHTGQIIAFLESRGQKMGAYNSQIAGHARSRGFTVITNNISEFIRIPGLIVDNWIQE